MEKGKIVYLSGEITDSALCKEEYASAEKFLVQSGYIVLNPIGLESLVNDLTPEQTMSLCYRFIDFSDAIFMMGGWQKSKEAICELSYAKSLGKKVMYQNYYHPYRKERKDEKGEESLS